MISSHKFLRQTLTIGLVFVMSGSCAALLADTDEPVRPSMDPFRSLVMVPVPEKPVDAETPHFPPTPPPPPVIVPVEFQVMAVAESDSTYVAVIEFHGQSYVVQKGAKIPDDAPEFTVGDISSSQVDAFDPKANVTVHKQLPKL